MLEKDEMARSRIFNWKTIKVGSDDLRGLA
jgi:hypothetical protein